MTHRMSALVVEDEWATRNMLVELLRKTGHFDPIAAVAQADEARTLLDGDGDIDAVFIDIRLFDTPGDTTGLQLAGELRRRPSPPMLVLATALPEHALDAYELGVVDYLLKPFRPERVRQCATRLAARWSPRAQSNPPRLAARTQHDIVFLDIGGVFAFEASDRLCYVHHVEGTYLVDLSLSALNAALGDRLMRVHRRWLVAPEHVQGLSYKDGALVLHVGDSLHVTVARDRAKAVRARLLASTLGLRDS